LPLLALSLYTLHGLSNLIHVALPMAKRIFRERKCYYQEGRHGQHFIQFNEFVTSQSILDNVNWFKHLLDEGKFKLLNLLLRKGPAKSSQYLERFKELGQIRGKGRFSGTENFQ